MAKKITIQHLYNTGNTMPDVSKLEFGEIAICVNAGNERIYTKNSDNTLAAFPSLDTVEALIDDATKGVITNANFSELQSQVETHINNTLASDAAATTRTYGHVVLVNSDLKDGENTNGAAAGLGHTHSQYQPKGDYLTGVTAGSGLAIVGIIENGDVELQLDSETNNKINSGVTAYDWGNHAEKGYAKNDDLTALRNSVTAHTTNGDIHITAEERSDWNTAANRINTFLDVETGATEALDSLHEIQEYLTGDGNSVKTLLESLNNLTDTVDNNTTAITQNSNNISILTTSASTNASNITVLDQTVTAINNKIGSGFTSDNTITSEINTLKNQQSNYVTSISAYSKNLKIIKEQGNKYTISHTSAGTQTSEITATNDTTDLSFGSEFNIVNKIGYDANGHVVTGSTQTLKLPTISAATISNAGIVSLKGGDLSTVATVVDGQAAASCHSHSQYVKFTDLEEYGGNTPLVISCGTY